MATPQPDGIRHESARRVALEARAGAAKLRRATVALGATAWHLVVWLGVFAAVWAALHSRHLRVIEVLRTPPASCRVLAALMGFAHSTLGAALAAIVVALSLAAFALFRERPASRRCFLLLATIGAASLPIGFIVVALGFLFMH